MSVYKPDEVAIRYAASCNPPRRAKRPRTASTLGPTISFTATTSIPSIRPAHDTQPSLAHIAPARSMSVATNSSEYDPDLEQPTSTSALAASNNAATSTSAANQAKRRGRKPSTLSRAARESARRQNHSRIEKARRTKINDALAALRELVPATVEISHGDIGEDDEEEDEEDDYVGNAKESKGRANNKGSKAGKEKEFKLEVLERTVIYVQELQGRVAELERTKCSECATKIFNSGPMPSRSGQKRKRDEPDLEEEEAEEAGEEEECPPEQEPTFPVDYQEGDRVACPSPPTQFPLSPASSTRRHSTASQSIGSSPYLLAHRDANLTRLPSINTWLSMPHHLDPSALPTTTASASIPQLLTPPQSTELPPTMAQQIPPTLSLDLPPASSRAQSFVMSHSSVTSTVNAASPPVSAGSNRSGGAAGHGQASSRTPPLPWTPEDESAASLLLHIRRGKTSDKDSASMKEVQQIQRVQTPSSLLGMKVDPHMRRA
ncbi:uncharacterized protein STEHIDRAFT_168255 [Stereum hirsutum FP-91666 SS1]|uniref:uncharacterized protein n=1 Tax=Stereum hirsutum (strain FP-91666) TaxID=721885 RepID=UPI000440D951|nr:uncharacterized protein STEHIDRAFT_168255 [Stereum hirsutum FP-91666 SS1]EIM87538.1 hypothetical protein STEHIDRAFT_168255 [Stereum hirsutum FP-91666 SS1]